jgi:hypothetical protein
MSNPDEDTEMDFDDALKKAFQPSVLNSDVLVAEVFADTASFLAQGTNLRLGAIRDWPKKKSAYYAAARMMGDMTGESELVS